MLRGHIDQVSSRIISGWAQDTVHPERPISLVVTNNDQLIARTLANRYREDLKNANIGSGRHAFEIILESPLSPFDSNRVRIFSEIDGSDVPGSPVVLQPSRTLKAAERKHLAGLLADIREHAEIDLMVRFLSEELDALKQRLADIESRKLDLVGAQLRQQTSQSGGTTDSIKLRRALVIDDRIPDRSRDAASSAILSHIESLQRLGYEVSFVPVDQFDDPNADQRSLDEAGVKCYRSPQYGSPEEIMRRQAQTFELVYLHRIATAHRYLALVRRYFPKARIVYSVADLHHVRLLRQATAEDRPELIGLSKRVRLQEFMAVASADATITHSAVEADLLRSEVRGARIHVVPWDVAAKKVSVPFAKRRDVAFIGGFGHQPNVDAARWLISTILPLVRQQGKIKCLLVGSEMPEWLTEMCGEDVEALGHVENLWEVFSRVRLTVAPLTYGAGVKGKVIESLAAGIPCICTPIAAEGLDFPSALQGCLADNAQDFADRIRAVHEQKKLNESLQKAGLQYVGDRFSIRSLDESMRKVVVK